jgi:hypothetical protein
MEVGMNSRVEYRLYDGSEHQLSHEDLEEEIFKKLDWWRALMPNHVFKVYKVTTHFDLLNFEKENHPGMDDE